MSKFTPGPWYAQRLFVRRSDTPGFGAWNVAEVNADAGFGGPDIGLANARLIAAAPDLYAACAGALSVMEADGYTGIVVHSLRAALAKARGE